MDDAGSLEFGDRHFYAIGCRPLVFLSLPKFALKVAKGYVHRMQIEQVRDKDSLEFQALTVVNWSSECHQVVVVGGNCPWIRLQVCRR